jgi:hypothetical protein
VSHTPGPWTAHERETSHGHHRILAGPPGVNESRVALAWHWPDARLIAAAPALLEALEIIVNRAVDEPGQSVSALQRCINDIGTAGLAAIAKAKGQS